MNKFEHVCGFHVPERARAGVGESLYGGIPVKGAAGDSGGSLYGEVQCMMTQNITFPQIHRLVVTMVYMRKNKVLNFMATWSMSLSPDCNRSFAFLITLLQLIIV